MPLYTESLWSKISSPIWCFAVMVTVQLYTEKLWQLRLTHSLCFCVAVTMPHHKDRLWQLINSPTLCFCVAVTTRSRTLCCSCLRVGLMTTSLSTRPTRTAPGYEEECCMMVILSYNCLNFFFFNTHVLLWVCLTVVREIILYTHTHTHNTHMHTHTHTHTHTCTDKYRNT